MATVLLVRHGQSSANVAGVLAGWSPGVALSECGREQAAALAPVLALLHPARVVSSPVQRCLETAQLLVADPPEGAVLPTVEEDDGLGECHYGTWTGRPLSDLATDPLWRVIQDDPQSPDASFPADTGSGFAGESLTRMTARLAAAHERLDDEVTAAHGPHALWVAVSHGDPIKSLLATASGAGVAGLQRFHVDPGSVSLIRRTGTGADARLMILGSNLSGPDVAARVASARPTSPTPGPGAAGDAVVGGGAG